MLFVSSFTLLLYVYMLFVIVVCHCHYYCNDVEDVILYYLYR